MASTFIKIPCTFCKDEASRNLWNYILHETRLSEKNAYLHGIHKEDIAAMFYDLDNDGIPEILGTHYSSRFSGSGNFFMYILKKTPDGYIDLANTIYYNGDSKIKILDNMTNGYHDILIYEEEKNSRKYAYDKNLKKFRKVKNRKNSGK